MNVINQIRKILLQYKRMLYLFSFTIILIYFNELHKFCLRKKILYEFNNIYVFNTSIYELYTYRHLKIQDEMENLTRFKTYKTY